MADLTIFTNALRDLVRPKKLIVLAILLIVAGTIAALWRFNTEQYGVDKGADIYNSLVSGLVFSFLLVILAIVYGSSIITQETEQKTIVYLLTRPVPRWRILLAKFAAVFLVVSATTMLATLIIALITYGVGGLGKSPLLRDLATIPVGVLAYGGIALLLGVLLNRPLVYGLMFAFGWESWVPSLPGSFSRVSVMTYLHVLAPHKTEAEIAAQAAQSANPFATTPDPDIITHNLAWLVLAGVIAVTIGLALWAFSTREYVPREEAS